ncbi:MAG: hypothetical protein HYY50_05745 [Candidatus Kerfeldbacteria bacterium]|nr:hypothetical protein [Candidatus Kerfeldbacteria bacterium]
MRAIKRCSRRQEQERPPGRLPQSVRRAIADCLFQAEPTAASLGYELQVQTSTPQQASLCFGGVMTTTDGEERQFEGWVGLQWQANIWSPVFLECRVGGAYHAFRFADKSQSLSPLPCQRGLAQ